MHACIDACVCKRERECVCVWAGGCACVRERVREREREREREHACAFARMLVGRLHRRVRTHVCACTHTDDAYVGY